MSHSPAHARPKPAHAVSLPVRILLAALCAVSLVASGALVAPKSAEAAVKAPVSAMKHPVLKVNTKGAHVKWVQGRLGVRPANGWYGATTRNAVKKYQKRHGLRVNGVVNRAMWRKLGVPYRPNAKASRSTVRTLQAGTAAYSSKVVSVAATTARGARYRYGATGPKSFDCSGYVGYVIKKATGKKLPRTAASMRSATKRISRSQARPGDLVFVHSGGRVSHVSIYAGGNRWWEASNPRTGVGKHKAWTSSVSYGRI